MQRFFGMMPSDEIKLSKTYYDGSVDNRNIRIDAGPNGWTVTWADGGTNYKDIMATTEENFQEAYDLMMSKFPLAYECKQKPRGEC
ncbi:MAG: hypothetical protein NC489_25620 [Ruminococcus flavefaciens]|nr:hypothetical protein [Ruminococcus flavefaciens]